MWPCWDFSALRYVRDKIMEFEMFTELDLLADPDEKTLNAA